MKTLKRIGCRVQTKGICQRPSPLFLSFFYPSNPTQPITSLKFIRRNLFFEWLIAHSRFSIFHLLQIPLRNSARRNLSARSRKRLAGTVILSCMAEGRKEGGILALTNLYDIRLCSCILLYVYRRCNRVFRPRAEFRIKKDEKKNRSSVCPFVDFAFYQKRKQRNSLYTYTRILVSYRIDRRKNEIRSDVIRFRTHKRNLCSRRTIRV